MESSAGRLNNVFFVFFKPQPVLAENQRKKETACYNIMTRNPFFSREKRKRWYHYCRMQIADSTLQAGFNFHAWMQAAHLLVQSAAGFADGSPAS